MQAFTLSNVSAAREQSGRLYYEFLRVPTMSAGLYQLNTGTIDPQQPHTEDELYYVVQGRAHLTVGTAMPLTWYRAAAGHTYPATIH